MRTPTLAAFALALLIVGPRPGRAAGTPVKPPPRPKAPAKQVAASVPLSVRPWPEDGRLLLYFRPAGGEKIAGLDDWNVRWVGRDGYQGIVARQLQEFKRLQRQHADDAQLETAATKLSRGD